MKKETVPSPGLWIILCAACFLNESIAQQYPALQFVESIPVETILDNADIPNAPDVWHEMISSSQRTLDIEQFYVSTQVGEAMEPVLTDIRDAAARGVRVRLIADAKMHATYPETVDSLGKEKNIETRVIDFGAVAKGIQHAKYFIVDGKDMFLGSQNFDWRALSHIHELGLRIRHEGIIRAYQDVFSLDWNLAEKGTDPVKIDVPHHSYPVPFRVSDGTSDTVVFFPTFSPRNWIPDSTLWDETQMVRLIDGAEKEVSLQFLSYSPRGRGKDPYTALDQAIRCAANRGVLVRMIVADWSKGTEAVKFLQSLSSVQNIEVKFSSIPDWSGGYVPFGRVEHCKFIVADRKKFWLGTSNGERSYFYSSRNLGIVVFHRPLANRLTGIFEKSWFGPYTSLVREGFDYAPREHGEKK
ncbi:MAG: phospholipase D-like domain-containing protein [Ignavibacteriales bacterium]|nr:phospholipase D-like domain-containing protein [Ignavibacteriales bacterium]